MKYLKKKDKPNPIVPVIVLCVAVVLGLLVWMVAAGKDTPAPDSTDPSRNQTDPQASVETQPSGTDSTDPSAPTKPAVLDLPYSLEDGKLSLDAVFQFSGLNPDRQDEEAEDVAAIQLTNASQLHLACATVTVITADGAAASFTVYDIPPGMNAIAVSPENVQISSNPECVQVTCEAEFLPQSPLADDQLLISVMGTDISVENISGEDLSQIKVYCHSMLDQTCYGGTTLVYEIDSLPAGESTVISAWECYLGLVEVVRIEIGSE